MLFRSYYICRKVGVPFNIYWDYPFDLQNYLLPNEYNWLINKSDVCYSGSVSIAVVDEANGLLFQEHINARALRHKIANTGQTHVYSNCIIRKKRFKHLFDELFKPSDTLASEINKHLRILRNNRGGYISVSLRFMELLGDFKDHPGVSATLDEDKQQTLIAKCISKIKDIIKKHPSGTRVFVASDSVKFLEAARRIPEVYVVEGEVVHIKYRGSDEAYMKTFVDLMLLKEADTRYLLKTGKMYNSGFPRFASWIGNGKFNLIEF